MTLTVKGQGFFVNCCFAALDAPLRQCFSQDGGFGVTILKAINGQNFPAWIELTNR
ncbi:hypothetical protein [Sulfitobacter pacificus]|uniref:hypothetical protein n=1 Tax=Sulfitobacter pacificus TaxID=1499314 RepID=UPI0024E12B00|nr:hypothetical protein [Sulfitobacter pacificus]